MTLPDQGFAIIDLPPISQEIVDSYHNVPLDEYMGNQTRYKRFSQYKLTHDEGSGWQFDLLPHRAYSAFKKFNPVAGGILRHYESIEVDFVPIIKTVIEDMDLLDNSEDWQINVHQNRSIASVEKPGLLTPEGVHQDGHEFVMIAVLTRHSVIGGEMRLWQGLDAAEPFWSGTLQPGQAAMLDDRAIAHDVTDLRPANGQPGHRDILITSFSRWREKWYGEEHEKAVLDGEAPTM